MALKSSLRLFRSSARCMHTLSHGGVWNRPRPGFHVGGKVWASSPLLSRTFSRSMFIQTQETPNPQSLKFLPGKPVLEEGSANFESYKQAQRSPLAKALFQIEGVMGVYLSKDFLSVTIEPHISWTHTKPDVFAAIMDFYTSNQPVLLGEDGDKVVDEATESLRILDDDDEIVALIKELLETRVRPHIQSDGGDLVYRGFENGTVFLQLQGSCVGCSSSSVTLKNMVQNMLCHYIPEVDRVEEWVDCELEQVSRDQLSAMEERLNKAQEAGEQGEGEEEEEQGGKAAAHSCKSSAGKNEKKNKHLLDLDEVAESLRGGLKEERIYKEKEK